MKHKSTMPNSKLMTTTFPITVLLHLCVNIEVKMIKLNIESDIAIVLSLMNIL
jgi:hypothetical protein